MSPAVWLLPSGLDDTQILDVTTAKTIAALCPLVGAAGSDSDKGSVLPSASIPGQGCKAMSKM